MYESLGPLLSGVRGGGRLKGGGIRGSGRAGAGWEWVKGSWGGSMGCGAVRHSIPVMLCSGGQNCKPRCYPLARQSFAGENKTHFLANTLNFPKFQPLPEQFSYPPQVCSISIPPGQGPSFPSLRGTAPSGPSLFLLCHQRPLSLNPEPEGGLGCRLCPRRDHSGVSFTAC